MNLCVHGLGYVGLATASLFANNGHDVTGYDVDDGVIEAIRTGEPSISDPEFETYVLDALSSGLTASDRPVSADVHFICVPTPYDYEAGRANLTYVEQASAAIADVLEPDDVVVLESTVPPGTTQKTLAPILSDSDLSPGVDFELGYTPETVMPGNTVTEIRTNDRIVGGVGDDSTATIAALYEDVIDGAVHTAPDATTAEFVKLVQNAHRDVNIAYANMLALVAADYGVDVRTAIDLSNNHPRVDILDPGPGVGGHCLPVDPLFLGQDSEETTLIDCARRVNDRMPDYVITRLEDALGTVRGATIAVLGVTYKGNVSDTRNSPGLAIARRLAGHTRSERPLPDGGDNLDVRLHDPVATDPTLALQSQAEALDGADAAVIAASHDQFTDLDPERVGELLEKRLVVDPLALLDADRWVDAGFEVVGL
ncbi:nucleotide sugar dehydrogenase [Halobellus sp. Atlit-38R]|uniref:nucleotide sugar dehydrogenase n=2 Tax=Haloferacaceae TaxID=1644056 RepID=UPI000EF27C38|nr:nucleotide sugar dehydrogenase [Halobellus sp. Atlit-38R]RLM89192.1 nucleotide sugar dehydrogenase [Halobellus sp. Atlit-38R]